MKKIYLAGPDVFNKNSEDIFEERKRLCSLNGFEGLSPLDNKFEDSILIYENNISLIHQCDIVMANVEDFRGTEVDSGTAFEIGYAKALGKTILLYNLPVQDMVNRVKCLYSCNRQVYEDECGNSVEDFGLPVNLMIYNSADYVCFSHFHDALLLLRDMWENQ